MTPRRAREPAARYLSGSGVLVDSNVLIDVLDRDSRWFDWSMRALEPLVEAGTAVIYPIICAELCAGYDRIEALEEAISLLRLVREPLPREAAFLASCAFKLYRERGGTKRSPLPDFYIGAHASVAGHSLLTRDPARCREHFPKLKIQSP